ncbi:TPA: IS3 family transposase [Stenotrophomonas maltophilia]|uniref:IS3 family transposase n=2 Tax=Stenotrophomonas maltophilia TaxID=40324 RepID=UPI000B4E0F1D|nr:IS3 family transposase [Stenotrophomonas maltophilia]MPS43962.1 IS3 family transposase [Stenotrophomonas sp.]MBA0386220.1 IS3 family transposase [Stenotrophomonas maltophilia]OWQ80833.1 IS3 family transposase [Stenotrophomonas maltophilia]QPX95443.1 IS3 family transposase [Stenotrophomonas maltophilia]HDS1225720.1 IS3 family transposase [Stenotrophomonas maltophilia]
MMSKQYTAEFKAEAVKQVTERGFAVAEVAKRLGVSSHSLYQWLRKARSEALAGTPEGAMLPSPKDSVEVRRLKAEVKRLTEERDIPKKSRGVLRQGMTAKYAFMREHLEQFRLTAMCRVLGVHRSGYYAWAGNPDRPRRREDDRLRGLIKHAWLASGTVYGCRKITRELRESGERCSRHRVRRLMKADGIRAEIGYGRKPRHRGGPVGLAENVVNRDFSPSGPNKVWVTDITYIRTYEGWLFLTVIVDLYSRQVVGWATQSQMTTDLVLQALVSAIWKRKPAAGLIIHSDQGSQFTSSNWLSLLKQHGIVPSMSRRGNCHDNAVAESFFSALKKERIKRRIYPTRDEAHSDVFNYIEMFYNPVRRHGSAGDLAPVEFERRYAQSGS